MKERKMFKKIRTNKWKVNWWYDDEEESAFSRLKLKVKVNNYGEVDFIRIIVKGKNGSLKLEPLPDYQPVADARKTTKTAHIHFPYYITDNEVYFLDLYFSFNRRSTSFFFTIDHFKNNDKAEISTFDLSLLPDPWTSHGRGGGGN
jgi:hypothetical protein